MIQKQLLNSAAQSIKNWKIKIFGSYVTDVGGVDDKSLTNLPGRLCKNGATENDKKEGTDGL